MDDLIAKAQRGDQVALARLLQANYLAVKKYLVTVSFNRTLAEDLTQETMIRAISRIGQYSGRAKFTTWLISIATNLYMDHLRHQQRERRLEEELAFDPPPGGLEPEWAEAMERLQALPRDVALPVVLKHYYGYTYEEIAEWMGIPEGTVKSRIFNGVRALRKGMTCDDGRP
ncbi:MAG TPA: RNA polymerase sigma factor SigY [Symbiobacteriaceae bacterium]|jgi:RNA polymerase sigma-70 factor (ECF subfamily)|nr:RNA polymerase sigma factor SigY [Symbiobacteriaceae bacterium]